MIGSVADRPHLFSVNTDPDVNTHKTVQVIRPFHRGGGDPERGVEACLAHHAPERDRWIAGHHRSCDGGTLRGLHGERGDRCGVADLSRRDPVHQLVVYRYGRAGGAFCWGERSRQGQSQRVPGLSRLGGVVGRRAGSHRVLPFARSAEPDQRGPGGAGPGAAVPQDHVPVQLRDDDVLPVSGCATVRRRRAHATAVRRRVDGPEPGAERGAHPRYGADPCPWDYRCRAGHRNSGRRGESGRHAQGVFFRPLGDRVSSRNEPEARLADHPFAVPVRHAGGYPGCRDEYRRRVSIAVRRVAGAKRPGSSGLHGDIHAALFADHMDLSRVDGCSGGGRRPKLGCRPSRTLHSRRPRRGGNRARRGGWRGGAVLSCPAGAARGVRHGRSGCIGSERATARLPERFGTVHYRGARLHRWVAGHRGHAEPAIHLDRIADHRAAGTVRDHPDAQGAQPR